MTYIAFLFISTFVILMLYKSMERGKKLSIGKRIKRLRTTQKLTQKQVADQLETDAAYISRIESNKQNPSISSLERMAKVLNCEVSDFFGEKINIPELKGKIDWLTFAEEMEEKSLTPEELRKIVEVFEMMKGKK